ncbi:MAG: Rab family GTPase [Promethearchaeota archaeon]
MSEKEEISDDEIQLVHTEGIVFKVIVVGDAEVGKTSLVRSHTKAKFDNEYHTTVGVNITKETLTVKDKKVSLLIWDIAGQVQFYMLHKVYFNGANGIIYVFDLTRPTTLANLKQNWFKSCYNYGVSQQPSILIGNKSDLTPKVIRPAALGMAKTLGEIPYFETSAKDGTQVDEAFKKLCEMMLIANNLV